MIRQDILIRGANQQDRPAVRTTNAAAFGRADEAELVDRLHDEDVVLLSLVAIQETSIIGHILFSRMWIDTAHRPIAAVALAPMAVLPEHQRQGVGSCLIRSGLDGLKQRGEQIVIVLGHPEYYPRFGFSTEKAQTLESPFRPNAFMATELIANALDGVYGRVRYPAAFRL